MAGSRGPTRPSPSSWSAGASPCAGLIWRSGALPGGSRSTLDAGLAFGSGEHGSTRGCLRALERVAHRRPRRILDLGTGSGILAMAAARLFCRRVLATDIDPWSVRVAAENASLNGVARLVRVRLADGWRDPVVRRAGPYDLVFANILARPLCLMAKHLAAHLAPGGIAILAGVLERPGAHGAGGPPPARLAAGWQRPGGGMDDARVARMMDSAEKLAAFRAELAAQGLQGFIVPRADEHLGEYVPASAERLAWLTGFTGSAGLAAVLPEVAALFTDGRYLLQLAAETDPALWERRHITENRRPRGWQRTLHPAFASVTTRCSSARMALPATSKPG